MPDDLKFKLTEKWLLLYKLKVKVHFELKLSLICISLNSLLVRKYYSKNSPQEKGWVRSFLMRDGGLVGFGKHHLKIGWLPLAYQFFFTWLPLVVVIFFGWPSTSPKIKERKTVPYLKFSTLLISSIICLLYFVVLTMKKTFTIPILQKLVH